MASKIAALSLPTPANASQGVVFRQLNTWAAQVTSALNMQSPNPGQQQSGSAGSLISTLSFSGSNATIDIAGGFQFVSGGTSLATIAAPAGFSGFLALIATNNFSLVSGGNVLLAGGASSLALVANQLVVLVYDGAHWFVAL